AAINGPEQIDGASRAAHGVARLGGAAAYPPGSPPAPARASEARLACKPLEATSTISSPAASSAPRIGARPRGTTPTAAPASSMSSSATSPGSDGDSPPPQAQPASAHALRQPSSRAFARSESRYQSE